MKLSKDNNGIWTLTITSESGKEHEVSLGTTNQEEAETLIKDAKAGQLEASGLAHRLTSEVVALITCDRNITVGDAISEWNNWLSETANSARTHMNNLGMVVNWARRQGIKDRPLCEITTEEINRWINDPKSPWKKGTRSVNLSAIRVFFNWCCSKRIILCSPANLVKVNHRNMTHAQLETKHKAVFTDAEIEYLLAKCAGAEPPSITPGFFRAAIILGRDLALRLGDIANLAWDSFDFTRQMVVVWASKSSSRVEVPMPLRVMEFASSWLGGNNKLLFPDMAAMQNDPSRRATLSVAFSRFFAANGFEEYSFHCLRATHATTMANRGATLGEISAALGHAGSEVTKAYVRSPDAAKMSMR